MAGPKAIQAFFSAPEVEEIENFRRAQRDIPSLAETLRTLAKRGLSTVEPSPALKNTSRP
jgi:hypothetical protein